MVPARRTSAHDRIDAPEAVADWGYDPGGQVGALQAEIARRLHAVGVQPLPVPIETRYASTLRSVSVTAGYATLAAGYGLVAIAGFYWA